MAKGVPDGWADHADMKLYLHGLIKILVLKQLEVKGMTWEVLLKQLHKEAAIGEETEDPASTSKSPSKNEKGSPSCTSAKRKRSEKSTNEKAPSSNKKVASTPTKDTPSTPPIQAQNPENDNLLVLADVAKFAEVEDDALLTNFIKKHQKKNKVSDAGKEPQSPQGVESPPALVQEEAPVREEELEEEVEEEETKNNR